jgi:uncharacterized protein (TIGR03435 family)
MWADLQLRLQVLLEDRFALKVHRETKDLPVYALTSAKGGLKLRPADCVAVSPNQPAASPTPGQPPPAYCGTLRTGRNGLNSTLTATGITIADLARWLSANTGRAVIDRTGYSEKFNATMEWTPDSGAAPPGTGDDSAANASGPSIFTALQEQLGLRLESTKGPVEVLVIDHVERPSDNNHAFFRKAMWTPQTFEVASVKPTAETGGGMSINRLPGGRFTTTNASLERLIEFSYDVRSHQISGGPKWLESDGFDIVAKAESENPRTEDFRLMIQNLLADRFKLALHRETKELSVYTLVVGKSGAKLQRSAKDGTRISGGGKGRTIYQKVSMQFLAQNLSQMVGRTVINGTGLKGDFDFTLEWTPGEGEPRKKVDGVEVPLPADASGPSIFTALQEQLGLKLESTKGPVEILVIDRAEKPSGN